MRISHLFIAAAALTLSLSACAAGSFGDGPRTIRIEGPDVVTTSPGVTYNVTGDMRHRPTVFVHEGSTVYAHNQTEIIAYEGAGVHGFDNAVIYYRQGAYVELHGNAKAFFCHGTGDAYWDKSQCTPSSGR